MSELHAAVALESLAELDRHLATRRALAAAYSPAIDTIPGLRLQCVHPGHASTGKDLTIAIDADYGLSRDVLGIALAAEGVDTRCYFDPPVHRQHADVATNTDPLPVTRIRGGGCLAAALPEPDPTHD
jgi:dTDP-4-amino-4,6-dideoxygalactose transaminase